MVPLSEGASLYRTLEEVPSREPAGLQLRKMKNLGVFFSGKLVQKIFVCITEKKGAMKPISY